MIWKNGETYFGNWENGFRSGLGVNTWPDGTKYFGEWNEDGEMKDQLKMNDGLMTRVNVISVAIDEFGTMSASDRSIMYGGNGHSGTAQE